MREFMKEVLWVLVVVGLIGAIIGFGIWWLKPPPPKRYCGKVVEMYRDISYHGKHHNSSPEQVIVFYCDELRRKVPVNVTNNCYVNTQVGESICFDLSEWQLNR